MKTQPILHRLATLSTTLHWPTPIELTKLHGDASARVYYRITREGGSSVILMVMPEGAASASEEITNFRGTAARPPFLLMADALRAAQLPVPNVLHHSPADRWIVLEDLGPISFFSVVAQAMPATRTRWYQQAIDLLTQMQHNMASGHSIAHQRSFDDTLLNWEFDHFAEYALAARGRPLSSSAATQFTAMTREITKNILRLPYCFTHRDFQSRNLMMHNNQLVLIDFQDALMGPCVYDLVALLRDSYIRLEPGEVSTLIEYYGRQRPHDFPLHEAFHWVTLQRKMKDAGRFVYIDQVKGNPNFMQYLPTTLGYVRQAFEQLPAYRPLFELLQPYVPEWQ